MDAQAGLLVVKILERRALLLGLDSPQKLDIVQVQAQETPPRHERIREAIMRLTRPEWFQNGGNDSPLEGDGAVDTLSPSDDVEPSH